MAMSQVKKVCGVGDQESTVPDYGFTCVDVEDYAIVRNIAPSAIKSFGFSINSKNMDDHEVLMTLLSNKWRACDEIANILQMEPNLVQKSLDRLTDKGIIEFDEQELVYYRKMQK
jgi:hypothetical protein